MTDNLIIIFFASLIFGGIAFILVYQLLKFLKGNVKISIPHRIYHYGEKLEGYIDIIAKKHLDIEKVEVEIKAYKKEKVHTQKGTKYRNIEIFKQVKMLSGKETVLAGSQRSIRLNTDIPSLTSLPKEVSEAIESYENTPKGVQKYYRGRYFQPKVYWKIRVHVFATGIDLYRQEHINIQIQK